MPRLNNRSKRSMPPSRLRWLALGLAFTVFGLGVAAVAPSLHDALHEAGDHEEHGCAVELFAHGVLAAATTPAAEQPSWRSVETKAAVDRDDRFAGWHVLPPACGPPFGNEAVV